MSTDMIANYEAALGKELGEPFAVILVEFMALHRQWDTYTTLFVANEQRFAVMNEVEPHAFREIERALVGSLISSIMRFADPAETKVRSINRKNCSLNLFKTTEPLLSRPQLLLDFNSKIERIKKRRHREISHKDLITALSGTPEPLPELTHETFKQAIDAIAAILIAIHDHHIIQVHFQFNRQTGLGMQLLRKLQYGLQFERELPHRICQGTLLFENLPPDL
jgi:hypothetical protein